MVINKTTTIENPFAGIFISGGAGSGKSKSLIEPLIKEAGAKNFTGVIYDFKFPELAQYVNSAYSNSQVKQYYFNFQDLNRSHKINPIAPNLMKNVAESSLAKIPTKRLHCHYLACFYPCIIFG